jgi:hypothetical protein
MNGREMWFWLLIAVVIVVGLGAAGVYDRRRRIRGDRPRGAAEIDREIAKRGRFDGTP